MVEAADAAAGIALCAEGDPDLVILDLGLPDRDGRELIAEVRSWSRVPILVVSGRVAASEKVGALDLGGSDYVVKPFSMPELLARVRALLRDRPRASEDAPVHRVGPLELDIARHRVTARGRADAGARARNSSCCACSMMHAGRVVPHKQLLNEIWGRVHENDVQYLRVYVGQLRAKLGDDPANPRFIANEQGVGYRFIEAGVSEDRRGDRFAAARRTAAAGAASASSASAARLAPGLGVAVRSPGSARPSRRAAARTPRRRRRETRAGRARARSRR